MTERITALLHEEADDLEIPTIPARQVIDRGRRMRRTHGAFQIIAAAAVVGVVAASALTWAGTRESRETAPTTSGVVSGDSDWAFAAGSTVHLSSGGTVNLPGQVKSLYYTMAGVLARTGKTAYTDAPDSNYWLIDKQGKVTDFELSLGDRVPGVDPDQPYIAYAEPGKDPTHWTVHVVDVRTVDGTPAMSAAVGVVGAFTWGGWVAPPVALDGSHVYVGLDDTMVDVKWTEGTVTESPTLPGGYMPTVQNGFELLEHWHPNASGGADDPMRTGSVVQVSSGAQRRLPGDLDDSVPSLSPTGRSVLLTSYRSCSENGNCTFDEATAQLFDVSSGAIEDIELTGDAVGWTRGGEIVQVGHDSVSVCNSSGCTSTPADVGDGVLRVAGSIYES